MLQPSLAIFPHSYPKSSLTSSSSIEGPSSFQQTLFPPKDIPIHHQSYCSSSQTCRTIIPTPVVRVPTSKESNINASLHSSPEGKYSSSSIVESLLLTPLLATFAFFAGLAISATSSSSSSSSNIMTSLALFLSAPV